jgi:hypothetical protein
MIPVPEVRFFGLRDRDHETRPAGGAGAGFRGPGLALGSRRAPAERAGMQPVAPGLYPPT